MIYRLSFFLFVISLPLQAGQFKASVMRLDSPVTLGDILEFEGSDEQKALDVTELANGWVSIDDIQVLLSKQNTTLDRANWKGPRKVWLQSCYRSDVSAFSQKVTDAVGTQLLRHNVTLVEIESPKTLESECFSHQIVDVKIDSVSEISPTRLRIDIGIIDATGTSIAKPLHLNFLSSVSAWVAHETIPGHQQLDSTMFKVEQVTWTGEEVHSTTPLNGLLSKKAIKSDKALTRSDITPQMPVNRGDKVKIIVTSGAVEISTNGHAMNAADIGDSVKVRVEGSNTLTNAEVIGKGIVNVNV